MAPSTLLAALLAVTTAAAPTPAAKPDAEIAAALRAHLKTAEAAGEFSGAVLLARGDEVLVREAYGLASRETGARNTPETKFNLGSIDKAFTKLVIDQLAAEGKLALADTIDKYVPEYPRDKGSRITLAQLLEHKGGTGDVFSPRYDAYDHARLRTLRDWLPLFANDPLEFEPGARQRYSNAGYVLLGLAIEKVTGRPYHDVVRERVLEPAGMKDTGPLTIDAVAGRATGYTSREGTPTDNRRHLPWRGTSAGGGYSTVDDLRRFADALRSGRINGKRGAIGIAGGALGISALLDMTGDYTLVVLANQDPPAAGRVAEAIAPLLGGDGAAPRRRRGGPSAPTGPMAAPTSTVLPPGGVEVPMLRHGHMPAVRVMVNGKGPFLFAIDTGAAGTARIDAGLAQRLGLSTVGEVRGGDPSGRNAETLAVHAVDAIEIGGARFEGVHAAARDMSALPGAAETGAADGILGFGLFADCLVTLDYPANVVRLERGEVAASAPGVVGFTTDRGVPTIDVTVAGRPLKAHVDSGFRGGFSMPLAEAERLPLAKPLEVVGRAQTVSNTFEVKAAPLDGDVAIGALVLARPTVEFQPVFDFANVGARVLSDLALTFDQKNGRVRIAKAR